MNRTLPARQLSLQDLWQFVVPESRADAIRLVIAFILVAVMGLAIPLFTAVIFDWLIPQSAMDLMPQIGLALTVAVLSRVALETVGHRAVLRCEIRTSETLGTATWKRLVDLPMSFFRSPVGADAADRAGLVDRLIRRAGTVGGAVLLAIPVTLANLIFMMAIHATLATLGLILAGLAFAGSLWLHKAKLNAQSRQYEIQSRLNGRLLELIRGLSKIRLAGATRSMSDFWSGEFHLKSRWAAESGRGEVFLRAALAGYTILSSAVLFAFSSRTDLSLGQFLALFASYGTLIASARVLADAWPVFSTMEAWAKRARPIFEEVPETAEKRSDPGLLTGEMELNDIAFRYSADAPWLLQDCSLHIKAGEFIGLTGPIGSGKSTFLKLLLGYEEPVGGTISWDHQDARLLDLNLVRQQIGVAWQNPVVPAGSLWRAIVGESGLTVDDAWQAAELAGLAAEIRALPMQMRTSVSEAGRNFSFGQRQRLMLARALVRHPRVLLLDDPASALDARTRSHMMTSLGAMAATRIVISRHPDVLARTNRIFVLKDGRISESGSYQELMSLPGNFFDHTGRSFI